MKLEQGFNNNPFMMKENFKNGKCDEIEMMFFYKYYNLAVTRFEWENLPKEIEPFFIEDVMFWRGKGVFIYDPNIEKYAFMRANMTGLMDIYNIPEDRFVFANTGYMEKYGKENSVILWDSPLSMPIFYTCRIYAKQMANLWKTRDINTYAQRTPVVLAMTEENKLSYENILLKYDNYVPCLKVNDFANLDKFKALSMEAPYLIDKLTLDMVKLEADLYTQMGFEINPIEKKERVSEAETKGNIGATEGYRNINLCTRQRCANAMNELWGTDVKVKFRSDLPTQLNMGMDFLTNGKDGANGYNVGIQPD